MIDLTNLDKYVTRIEIKPRHGYKKFGVAQSLLHAVEVACLDMFKDSDPEFARFRARMEFKHFRKIELRLAFSSKAEQRAFETSEQYHDLLFRLLHVSLYTKVRSGDEVAKLPHVTRTHHGYKVSRFYGHKVSRFLRHTVTPDVANS